MDVDFKPPLKGRKESRFGMRRGAFIFLFIFASLTAGLVLLGHRPAPSDEIRLVDSAPASPSAESAIEIPSSIPPTPPPPEIRREVLEGAIAPGETLTSLLKDYLSPQEIHSLSLKSREIFPLSRICAGQPYRLCVKDGEFESFEYDIDAEDQLIIRRDTEDFQILRSPIEYVVETDHVSGIIRSSLFEAVTESGEKAEMALALSDIFAWDIDFIRDIRQGDSFQVLVEKRFRKGEPAGYGRILAARFTNQGQNYNAFLFQDGDRSPSYYDTEGNSVRKAFLKAPLSFTRISSGFSRKRFHPITKTWKAHPAIDYAAPSGTPIKSVGDGTIIRIGHTKYNGNFVKIRHNSSYETLYLHMKGFGRGMKNGKKVVQGQVIGYVGSTGLATGPHLCFRMYKNGTPVNPYRVKSPAADPVSSKRLADFQATIAPYLATLEGQDMHARAETNENPLIR